MTSDERERLGKIACAAWSERLALGIRDIQPTWDAMHEDARETYRLIADAVLAAANPAAVVPPWTTDKPTIPGWYWMRLGVSGPYMVELVPEWPGTLAIYGGTQDSRKVEYVDNWEWSGPIPSPRPEGGEAPAQSSRSGR